MSVEDPRDAVASDAVAHVEAESRGLRRTLGLRDLVLAQVLLVVGVSWIGVAARLGGAGLLVWLAGFALFHLPLAAAVMHFSRRYPLEGGLYQWTKLELGEAAGFLVAWNGWLFVIVFMSSLGLVTATALAYAAGEPAWAESPAVLAVVSAVTVAALVALALAGLGAGRWLHDLGALVLVAVAVAMVGFLATRLGRPAAASLVPSLPPLELASLNVFVKTAVYGLAGLECMSILAGESRDPARAIGRSVAIAAPCILVFYLSGTALVVATVPRESIDLVNPVAQVLTRVGGEAGLAGPMGLLVLLLFLRDFAQSSQVFAANARLPMVVGWDRLLPAWLGRLDRRGVPRGSIFAVGGLTLLSALLGSAGAGRQEAYQLLLGAAGVFFALTYVALFALPLFGRGDAEPPPPALRLACACGLAMTVAFLALSLFPVTEVPSPLRFGARVAALVAVGEGAGLALLRRGRRREAGR